MDVSFSNVVEGTRQYFLGVPKASPGGSGGPGPAVPASNWPEAAPAQSGAPAPLSRPPSAAAAPPLPPPRPPSSPLEPEPHIIHKATVMREALERRRDLPSPASSVSPAPRPADPPAPSPAPADLPSYVIRRTPHMPSPAPPPTPPQPRAPTPATLGPAPPNNPQPVPHQSPGLQSGPPQYMAQGYRAPPQPQSQHHAYLQLGGGARPADPYARYAYEQSTHEHLRRSPHGYRTAPTGPARLRDSPAAPSSPVAPPPPHNDRVPPIHHHTYPPPPPQPAVSSSQRLSGSATVSAYPPPQHQHRSVPYDRHPTITPRKYDPQQTYSGYRPEHTHHSHTSQVAHSSTRPRTDQQPHYQHYATDVTSNHHYPSRPPEAPRVTPRPSYAIPAKPAEESASRLHNRNSYEYAPTATTNNRSFPVAVPQPSANHVHDTTRAYRLPTAAKPAYEYTASSSAALHISPSRVAAPKPAYSGQHQPRPTVSVTSIVNQMNQTKHKRESPLDLSVKTVKNSADSTAQDEVDTAVIEIKSAVSLQPRVSTTRTHPPAPPLAPNIHVAPHKVDFAPNFQTQYSPSNAHAYNAAPTVPTQPQHAHRYNGANESPRPPPLPYTIDNRYQTYPERSRYPSSSSGRSEHGLPKIDLTRAMGEERYPESRPREDRRYASEDGRKRISGQITSNVPEKIVRYDSWSADGRTADRMIRSAREQRELMSRPVYSYSSLKRLEAYHNEQQRAATVSSYRDPHYHPHNTQGTPKDHQEARLQTNDRHYNSLAQKMPSHRELLPQHHLDRGVPADKRVLSILRNSLETRHIVETTRPTRHIPELIVIDDADDDITDLTKENDIDAARDSNRNLSLNRINQLHMPKAVDSIRYDESFNQVKSCKNEELTPRQKPVVVDSPETKSPENDVARIRTKAELKVLPPSQSQDLRNHDTKRDMLDPMNASSEKVRVLPKSQKEHLFRQLREETEAEEKLRLEVTLKVSKQEEVPLPIVAEVKAEPMNIDEIEKDALVSPSIDSNIPPELKIIEPLTEEDLMWGAACDSFVEQLQTGCVKKKTRKKRVNTFSEIKTEIVDAEFEPKNKFAESLTKPESVEAAFNLDEKTLATEQNTQETESIIIKQEPVCDTDDKLIVDIKKEPDVDISCVPEEDIPMDNEVCDIKIIEQSVIISVQDGDFQDKLNEREKDELELLISENSLPKTVEKPLPIENEKSQTREKTSSPLPNIKKEKAELEESKGETESESTDDDVPLIKSKLLKDKKEHSERLKHQLLKDLSEKSVVVKLECCDALSSEFKSKSFKLDTSKASSESKGKGKATAKTKNKRKSLSQESKKVEQRSHSTSDSDSDVLSVASRLRTRKNTKTEDTPKSSPKTPSKHSSSKSSPKKQETGLIPMVKKPGFGDGSDFHPGWEEELYRYKRSLRMPTRLIAIPRASQGGGRFSLWNRGSTSLPDLDPTPLSPAPSSAPSVAATDDLYARRQDKLALDSDLDSNSSCSAPQKLHYDSEASCSTTVSGTKMKRRGESFLDLLIQKYGRKDDFKKKDKEKLKEDPRPKIIPKSSNTNELLPTPSLGLEKSDVNGPLSAKKEKLMEDIYYLGPFRKETVSALRNEFINNTDGLIGATEEFTPVMLKTRTRTESRVLKQRATIKEVFGDERPASAPPSSCRDQEPIQDKEKKETLEKEVKSEETKVKPKPKKHLKDKLKKNNSIRDGLRSTSLKRSDAKGRLLRLKKRNNLIKCLTKRKIKEIGHKKKEAKSSSSCQDKEEKKPKADGESPTAGTPDPIKRRFKRLFPRRKFSSGFDYIRKKKKLIRKEDETVKVRRNVPRTNPESVDDIHKEIKSWFINKSVGETSLHRAARLGYTDCVAYCLEKLEMDPSVRDNAGLTPLHMSAARGHLQIARLLLQYGANVSAAATGGIRPLHEAAEGNQVETIRLLLAYGADPALGTYAGQMPAAMAQGEAQQLIRAHLADVQGRAADVWRFHPLTATIDPSESGCDALASPPSSSPPPPDTPIEIQCTEAPLPPFYSLRPAAGPAAQPTDGLWCLLQDVASLLQIKSKESLLKAIHCGSGSPKELLRELRTSEFLERAQCHQLLGAGEKVNVRASKVALVRVTDKLRQLLRIETVLIS